MNQISKKEVQEMIDDAIKKHNFHASIISAILGFTLMAFYAHGVITLVK
jgi:hypothetical protein